MTPLQGLGGSSALRDAGQLRHELVEVHTGTCISTMAIRRYEKAMIDYGLAAVRRSAWIGRVIVSDNRLLRGAFKAALRVATSERLIGSARHECTDHMVVFNERRILSKYVR